MNALYINYLISWKEKYECILISMRLPACIYDNMHISLKFLSYLTIIHACFM